MPINRKLSATFQGKPCAQGHDGLRYVSGKGCVECAKIYSAQRAEKEAERQAQVSLALFEIMSPPPMKPTSRPRFVAGRCQSKGGGKC